MTVIDPHCEHSGETPRGPCPCLPGCICRVGMCSSGFPPPPLAADQKNAIQSALLEKVMNKEKAAGAAAEAVNHPSHYQALLDGRIPIEAKDVTEAWALDHDLATAVEYILRAGRKDGNTRQQDLKKAIWYLQRANGGNRIDRSAWMRRDNPEMVGVER